MIPEHEHRHSPNLRPKKNPGTKAGRVRGIVGRVNASAPENLVQSGPAKQLHSILVQVEIAGQYGLDVARV